MKTTKYANRICPPPPRQGLYDPQLERDACGVGMICDIQGGASHGIVQTALEMAVNLTHRGACGCDATTGDGAGILIQLPDAFLRRVCGDQGFDLPETGAYGTGLFFLPPDPDQRACCCAMFEAAVKEQGQTLIGWRRVPVNSAAIGGLALSVEPAIRQVFVGRGPGLADARAFERKLYVIRKLTERALRSSDLPQKGYGHIPSLSARTMVYKGMFVADQLGPYFPDLAAPDLASALAIVHQRYSTNTFPAWGLAQPFRFLCHNGEINTLRGNINWMNARQALFGSNRFGGYLAKLFPIATPGASDSAILDNALELLYHSGRSLPHAIMMLIPEAWQEHRTMSQAKKDFYAYHACLMEPWDGPASIPFTDGVQVGAVLDRNGLRPSRYTVTRGGRVIMASETGVVPIAPENIAFKGRLQPGRMFLVNTAEGRIVEDEEIKETIAARQPYGQWLGANLVAVADESAAGNVELFHGDQLFERHQIFGYTVEDLKIILAPMALTGVEPTGSMGDDTPPAVLSKRPRLLYDYFKQLFAQVTNPPLDAIREKLVTSLTTTIGAEKDLFAETPAHARQLRLKHPILTTAAFEWLQTEAPPDFRPTMLPMTFDPIKGGRGLAAGLDELCRQAADAVRDGAAILILTDRPVGRANAPIPALLATAAVHHHLIREGLRTRCGLVIDSGEAREIHHFCCLLGYGAGAVHPYLAYATLADQVRGGQIPDLTLAEAIDNYRRAAAKGILKVMSKMGISTLQSYRGAQIFECVGINPEVVDRYFTWTPTRIGGADLDLLATEVRFRHRWENNDGSIPSSRALDPGGKYKWRRSGEKHQYNPLTIARLQQAVRQNDREAWQEFVNLVDRQNREEGLLRGLVDFIPGETPVPLEEVEPWETIVKRFKTGAMSYGSISREAHETQAIAMNRLGGKSNSGEGGEDADRFAPDGNGDRRSSAIKQVASGRFGVTINYLTNAVELQIKMAQGAKPGEGGQLPGGKVYPWIAKTRHSTPWVGLISPPPHHDIYSIEDLAQLIYDLKRANPAARVSVKLVSEVGVGTVAAGVAKAGADVVLISGDSGGTGASPQSSVRYGGVPWELGLSEAQQVLKMNGLRDRIVVETDGQLKTARDVAVACLLGAEEFGFGTVSLVSLGCVMMRVCHLNTCPVGIATQDPELRQKFTGRPEHLVNFMRFVAQDLRHIMAALGFRRVSEMVGRVDRLSMVKALDHWKARDLDFSAILKPPEIPPAVAQYCLLLETQTAAPPLDEKLIAQLQPALDKGRAMSLDVTVRNVDRTVGATLSHEIAKRYGDAGLPADTIVLRATGTAGQSFGAFGAPGLSIHLQGEANDYFGKGLSGARLSIRPQDGDTTLAEENIVVGNVALYGATAGEVFIRGRAGERFGVRNSGATAVVEGIGDHGCEYMTGGRVVVLGTTGRNFAAGMSGGIAYVLDADGFFRVHGCNTEMVDLEAVETPEDVDALHGLIRQHQTITGSALAARILADWDVYRPQFVKIMPVEYKRALEKLTAAAQASG
jgi:glutamate synthase domain-containing protein 2/glutamate synthase domain-containing protein 1/glutamate synthase domain-containing protein 3